MIICRHCKASFPPPRVNEMARVFCPNCGRHLLLDTILQGRKITIECQTYCITCRAKLRATDILKSQVLGFSLAQCAKCLKKHSPHSPHKKTISL